MKYRVEGKVVRTSDRPYSHAVGYRDADGTFRCISCCRTYELAVKAAGAQDVRSRARGKPVEIVKLEASA